MSKRSGLVWSRAMDAKTFFRIASLSVGSLSETGTYIVSQVSPGAPQKLTLCGNPDVLSLETRSSEGLACGFLSIVTLSGIDVADARFQCVNTRANSELQFFADTTGAASPCEERDIFAIREFEGEGHYCEV